jgi:hypothetical protein
VVVPSDAGLSFLVKTIPFGTSQCNREFLQITSFTHPPACKRQIAKDHKDRAYMAGTGGSKRNRNAPGNKGTSDEKKASAVQKKESPK